MRKVPGFCSAGHNNVCFSSLRMCAGWAASKWTVRTTFGNLLHKYYRRYIPQFSNITAPLHKLTQKGEQFIWSDKCQVAFFWQSQAPVLVYPDLSQNASSFVLQSDAISSGLGAVLEQDDWVIGHASRTLSKSEQNYSVIEKECLAVVHAMKQFCHYLQEFCHYLQGYPFQLITDL